MLSVLSDIIDNKRDAIVNERAKKLFEDIVSTVATQPKQETYSLKISFQHFEHETELEKLVFNRTIALFNDMDATLSIERENKAYIKGTLNLRPKSLENDFVCTFYWSAVPGIWVNKQTGTPVNTNGTFTGTIREWNETFVETIFSAVNEIHKVMLSSPTVIFIGSKLIEILKSSVFFRESMDNVPQLHGTLSNRFTVYESSDLDANVLRMWKTAHGKRFTVEIKVI